MASIMLLWLYICFGAGIFLLFPDQWPLSCYCGCMFVLELLFFCCFQINGQYHVTVAACLFWSWYFSAVSRSMAVSCYCGCMFVLELVFFCYVSCTVASNMLLWLYVCFEASIFCYVPGHWPVTCCSGCMLVLELVFFCYVSSKVAVCLF